LKDAFVREERREGGRYVLDLATKVLYYGKKRRDMVMKLLYNIYDDVEGQE
jgi:hypothetical protein